MKVKALENLYRRGKVTKDGLEKAVADGVITQAQRDEILASK